MAAVLSKGSKIISVGINKPNSYHKHFVKPEHDRMALHAEVSCLYNVKKDQAKGCTLYVFGETAGGNNMLTKPCFSCTVLAKQMGVKKVIYEDREGSLQSICL